MKAEANFVLDRGSMKKLMHNTLRDLSALRKKHRCIQCTRVVGAFMALVFCVLYAGLMWHSGGAFTAYPDPKNLIRALSFVHINTGSLWLLLSTLQIWPSFRVRNLSKHRNVGKAAFYTAIISTISLLVMVGTNDAEGGAGMTLSGPIFALIWVISLRKGMVAISEGRIEAHRAHMLRAYCVSWAIIAMRPLVSIPQAMGYTFQEALGATAAVTWISSLILIELYIRRLPVETAQDQSVLGFQQDSIILRPLDHFIECTLKERVRETSDTSVLTFELPEKSVFLSTPPGQHYSVRAQVNGEEVTRPYTPIVLDTPQRGTLQLLVKRYEYGKMSQHLHSIAVGSKISILGPVGGYRIRRNEFSSLGLIAGGTGLTPIMSVLHALLKDPYDSTMLHMLYVNRDEEIPLKTYLDDLRTEHKDRITIRYAKGRADSSESFAALKDVMVPQDDAGVLVCGPIAFMDSVITTMTKQGHDRLNIHAFGFDDH